MTTSRAAVPRPVFFPPSAMLPASLRSCLFVLAALLVPAAAGLCGAAASTTLLRESFDSGVSSAWRPVNAVPSLAHRATTPISELDGNALRHVRTRRMGKDGMHCVNFEPTTLAPGESLTLSFDFRGVSYARNKGNQLVFGFLRGVGVSPASPEGATGYAAALRVDGREGLRSRFYAFRALNLAADASGEGGEIGDEEKEARRGNALFYLHDDNLTDRFRFTLTVTRLPEGELQLDATFLNRTREHTFSVVRTVPVAGAQNGDADAAYNFDGVAIGFRRAGSEDSIFDLDNIEVTRTAAR